MNTRKILLLISYSCILVYIGGLEWTMPKLTQPIFYFFLRGSFYHLAGILLILSYLYLLLTPFIYPYRKDYVPVFCVMLFYWLTLVPDLVYLNVVPAENRTYFLVSIIFFVCVSAYIVYSVIGRFLSNHKDSGNGSQ